MAITPQQAVDRYFKPAFKAQIQAQFNADEINQLFSPEGMMFFVSSEDQPHLAPEYDKTHWKVQMSFHKDTTDTIDGIFLRATSENHQIAWIESNLPTYYNPCFTHITNETIRATLATSELPGEAHGSAPEIVQIVLKGKKEANPPGGNSNTLYYAVAAGVLLLALAYLGNKYFSQSERVSALSS